MKILIVFVILVLLSVVYFAYYHRKERQRTSVSSDTGKGKDTALENEGKWVDVDAFIEKYIVGESIPETELIELQLRRLSDEKEIWLSQSFLDEVEVNYQHYLASVEEEKSISELAEEQKIEKDLASTIRDCERMIEKGYPACLPFDRLISLYHRLGQYEDEVATCERAMHFLGSKSPQLQSRYHRLLQEARRDIVTEERKDESL